MTNLWVECAGDMQREDGEERQCQRAVDVTDHVGQRLILEMRAAEGSILARRGSEFTAAPTPGRRLLQWLGVDLGVDLC